MILAVLFGYLLGSIPSAVIVGRRHAVDPRQTGDGNAGWWNMRAVVGERAALAVLIADTTKGATAATIGLMAASSWWVAYSAGIAAVVGHAFPLFARFKGGKSVLTWIGASLVLTPVAAGTALAIAAVVGIAARRPAPAALVGCATFPFIQAALDPLTHVALSGVMMTFVGLRFVAAKT